MRTILRSAGLVAITAAAIAVYGTPAQAAPPAAAAPPIVRQAPVAPAPARTAPVPDAAPTPDTTRVAELPDLISARRRAAAQGSRVKISASGTAGSQTYANPNGTLSTETYQGPAFHRSGADRTGLQWVPLSGALAGAGTTADPLRVPDLPRPAMLGRSAADLIQIAAPGGTVSIGSPGLRLGTPSRSGDTVTYGAVAPDTDLQLVPSPVGVKTNLVLRSAAAPRSFRFHVADPMGRLGSVAPQPDGSWLFSGAMGDGYRLALAPAAAYRPGQAPEPGSATQTVLRAGDGWDVTLAVDPAWLAGKAFPVVLDPSPVFVSGTAGFPDCHLVSGSFADQSFCNSASREVGLNQGFLRRTIMAFDLGSIPTTAQVSGADLDLDMTVLTGAAPMSISAHRMTGGWATTATWNSNGAVPWTGGNADLSVELARTDIGSSTGHYHWTITAPTVQGWVSKTSGNWGLLLKETDETVAKLVRFDSGFATDPSVRPRLTVTYSDPAALQTDRTDSYQPLVSGLVTGTGAFTTTFTVTPPTGLGAAFTSPTIDSTGGRRSQFSIPIDKVVAGKTYTWTMKNCQSTTCTTSGSSFTVDPLIASGERGFFTYRDWQLSDRLKLRVNVASGDLLAEMTDLSVPGVVSDSALGRTYNSLALAPGSQSASGAAGPGWQTSIGSDVRVVQRRDGSATVYLPSGYAALFAVNATGGFTGPPGINATLSRNNGNWRYADHRSGAEWDFDSSGRLTGMKDRSDNAVTIRRDGSGNVSAVDGSRGGPDPTAGTSARRILVNDAVSPSTGALRNYKQLPNPGSPLAARSVVFGYTGSDLTSVTDAGGKTTTFGYDTSHRLTSITTASDANTVAHTTTIGYESGGFRVSSIRQETTAAGVGPLTSFVYDDINKQTTVTPPKVNAAGNVQRNITYAWDNRARVTKLTNGFGKAISTRSYTGNNQVATSATAANSAAGTSTVNTYAANGENLTKSVSSAAATTEFQNYGAAGSQTEFLPGTSKDASNTTTTYRYDGAGNLSGSTGGVTNEAVVERNPNGTVKFSTDPENVDDGTTKAAPACQRTGHTDNCTTYSYDAFANLITVTRPDNAGSLGIRHYTYDGFGRLSTLDNGRGIVTTYTYDAMDRTTKAHSSRAGDTDVSYVFDAVGNQVKRTDATGTVTYRYDKLNRLTLKDLAAAAADCSAGPTGTRLCYAYDDASNLVSLGDGRGTTTYHYSPISLLDEVNENTGRTIVMAYDDDQHRVQTWFATNIAANGTTYTASNVLVPPTTWVLQTKNTLDGDARLTRTTSWRGGVADDAHRVADWSYSYKQVALPTACVNSATTGRGVGTDAGRRIMQTNNLSGTAIQLCYDTAGRLVYRTSDGSLPYRYTYDKDGNRLTDAANTTVTTYTYNAGNQTTTAGFSYDAAGNQTAGTPLSAAAYNGFDQATSVTPSGGSATALAAAGTTNAELVTQGGTTLRNGIPGVQSLVTSAGTSFVQGDPSGNLLGLITGGIEYYYVLDGQGSVIGLVDSTGLERARYTYDPYGGHDTATAVNGTLPANPFRYNSGLAVAQDASSHVLLYHFGERYYAPATGRWTQQDNLEHLGDPAQGNRYAYVAGDPVNYVDPTGRNEEAECLGASLAYVGAVVAVATAPIDGPLGPLVAGFLIGLGSGLLAADSCGLLED
jgi:RHS repeat-associated protein